MSKGTMYAKLAGTFVVFCLGGPALMYYVTPSEGELFKRFNPELQKYNLENRERRQADYEDFVTKLKEYSKSDKPIWEAAADAQKKARAELIRREADERDSQLKIKEQIRLEAQGR